MVDHIQKKEYTWEELKSLVQHWNREHLELHNMSDYRMKMQNNKDYASPNVEKFFSVGEKDVDR